MDRLHAMKVFLKVVECGGFAGAGRALSMSPPAVTRAVAALEEVIGARLLTRTTRTVKLTEAGTRYAEDCRRILADLAESEASAAGIHARPSGTLVVSAPVLFGQMHVLPILLDFLGRHPAVSGRALFLDRIVSLIEEGVDVAVRIAPLPDSEYRAIPVGSVRRVVCASPAYLRKHGTPATPADLADHTLVAASATTGPLDLRFGRDRKTTVRLQPRLTTTTLESAIIAATRGWGLTRALSYQVGQAVAEKKLQIVLSEHEEEPLPIHVVYAEGRRAPAKVRAFVEFAVERLRGNKLINP
ncbi:MAG TPA: LysR family transcriptional regulator [Nevskia sp.]|nr:LysR family transcriptional regulator [Nevskia sp.]